MSMRNDGTRCPSGRQEGGLDGLPVKGAAVEGGVRLARLVDEVYFECHFRGFPVDFGWGLRLAESSPTAKDCLELMRKLRHGGVRSHFWV